MKLQFIVFFLLAYAVMWGPHVDYITSAVGHMCLMWQADMFRGICQCCKCMYNSACGQIGDLQ